MMPIIAALALSILGAPTVAPTAASINADIAKAIVSGKTSYALPSNKIALEPPIVIPAGARNFALLGRKGGTVLTAKTGIGYEVTAGVQANDKNWPLDGYPTAAVETVPDKTLSVTQDGTLSVKVGDYLELWDSPWVTHANGQDSLMNRAEIVHVAKVDGKTITFRDTTIRMLNKGPYTPIVLSQTNASTFRLILDGVRFTTVGSPWSAVQLAKGFRGQVVARESIVQTGRAGAAFIDNQGAVKAPALSAATVAP